MNEVTIITDRPAPPRATNLRSDNGGKYGHIRDGIKRLKPGGWFDWTGPQPKPKHLSTLRIKLKKRYPHIDVYYADKFGGRIIVKDTRPAEPQEPVAIPEPDEDDEVEIDPVDVAAPRKRGRPRKTGPVFAPPVQTRPPSADDSGIYLPQPGRAQRIAPSKSSDRWATEIVKRSEANAAAIAGSMRDPLPGVAPMRTFGGE